MSPWADVLLGERHGERLVGISSITSEAVKLFIWLLDLSGRGSTVTLEDEGAGPSGTKL